LMNLSMNDAAQTFIAKARSLLSDDYLPKIERCLVKLSDEEVWRRTNPESNSIGNLLLHLAGNARQWITSGIGGSVDDRMRQQEFDEQTIIPRAELLALLRQTLCEVDVTLAALDPSCVLDECRIQGYNVTVLEAVFHVIEHFSMHTGQIILLTKMLKSADLKFYDFSDIMPKASWQENK